MEYPASAFMCRDCLLWLSPAPKCLMKRCPKCNSTQIVQHGELAHLSMAHIDCDAFYAAVEKLDNPELQNKPVMIGGEKRGVVSTACYLARLYGVRSAMPMFQAKQLCPDAVILPPRMKRYQEVGYAVREKMHSLSPLVEPLSIDEAFVNMAGTQRLHGKAPALQLAKLAQDVIAKRQKYDII